MRDTPELFNGMALSNDDIGGFLVVLPFFLLLLRGVQFISK